jgi:MerR family mercuric resistance operon transcriptional regulator
VHVETVRYYERRGLVPAPPRRQSGYRQYSEDVVARIQFIKRAQDLGFSLNEITELLSLRVDSHDACADVQKRAEAKIADVERRMRDLQQIKLALSDLVIACGERGPTGECPILEALATPRVQAGA